jgi:hypothetical protein
MKIKKATSKIKIKIQNILYQFLHFLISKKLAIEIEHAIPIEMESVSQNMVLKVPLIYFLRKILYNFH